MNIWLLTNEYPPFYGGGIGTYSQTMAKMFADGRHSLTVITLGEKDGEEIVSPNLRIIRFPEIPTRYNPFSHEADSLYNVLDLVSALPHQFAETTLKQLKKSPPPDILEVQDCLALGYFLLRKKALGEPLLKNIPIVVNLHTPLSVVRQENLKSKYHINTYLLEHLEKSCLQMADAVICPSRFLKERLQTWCPEKEITVLPLPAPKVNSLKLNPFRHRQNKIDLLYLGRLEYRKGAVQLLAGAEKLWRKGLSFNLVLVGGDEWYIPEDNFMADFLKQKYAKYIELGRLKIIDKLPQAQVYELLRQTKIFVMPSLFENFPYVCLEAMNFAKPILAASSGGQVEIIGQDESCGLVFDWSIPGNFEKQLTRLLKMPARQLRLMGRKARKRLAKLCNHKDNLRNKLKIFKKIIANHKSPLSFPEQTEELLSIIIPFQDSGQYIAETLQSVLLSDYSKKEIIIVDAASSKQESIDVLQEIKNSDFPNVTILKSDSAKLALAVNQAVQTAKGKYLGFISPGDIVAKTFYSKMITLLQNNRQIGFAYSWVQYIKYVKSQNRWEEKIWHTCDVQFPLLLAINTVPPVTVVNKDVFLEHGLLNESVPDALQSYESWLRIHQAGFAGVSIPEVLSVVQQKELQVASPELVALYASLYQKYAQALLGLMNVNQHNLLYIANQRKSCL